MDQCVRLEIAGLFIGGSTDSDDQFWGEGERETKKWHEFENM